MEPSVPRYEPATRFHQELKKRVDAYFDAHQLKKRENGAFFVKCAVILTWFLASYLFLVFGASTSWGAALAAVSLAFSIAGIGFSIAHDANHYACSSGKWANPILSITYDLMGVSSFIWRWKHNVLHHTHTNVSGVDTDIENDPMLRLSPYQAHHGVHRFQFLYAWILYGLLVIYWQFVTDFATWITGTKSGRTLPKRNTRDHLIFWGGKLVFFTWAFIVPLFFHPLVNVLFFYILASSMISLIISVVFQLAHCRAEANFATFDSENLRIPVEWAQHQVETTVDFCRDNRILGWYLGGLGFQVEHHLFPTINHIHYRALAPIVEETSREFGIRYCADTGFLSALSSHFNWLVKMGRPETETSLLSVSKAT